MLMFDFFFILTEVEVVRNEFSASSGPIFLERLFCTGDEPTLLDCSSGRPLGLHTCPTDHSEDVGIRCRGLLLSTTCTQCVGWS